MTYKSIEQRARDLFEDLEKPMPIGSPHDTRAEEIVINCIRHGVSIYNEDSVLFEIASLYAGSFQPGETSPNTDEVKEVLRKKYWPDIKKKLEEAAKKVEQEVYLEEQPLPGWQYLVSQERSWRKQAYLKGRNVTVGQLISTIKANKLTPTEAASDLDLSLEAIEEVLKYYDQNRALVEQESEQERRHLEKKGYTLEPQDLSR